MAEKRLKKNISFSEHERDIYEYLDTVGNASAFIKRLILNHMLMEQGVVVPRVVVQEKENVTQGTNDKQTDEVVTQETNNKETEQPKEVIVKPKNPPSDEEIAKILGMKFTEEDKLNQQLLPDL